MIKIEDDFSFNKGDIIVVGCSTGPDSMALVDMLLQRAALRRSVSWNAKVKRRASRRWMALLV